MSMHALIETISNLASKGLYIFCVVLAALISFLLCSGMYQDVLVFLLCYVLGKFSNGNDSTVGSGSFLQTLNIENWTIIQLLLQTKTVVKAQCDHI